MDNFSVRIFRNRTPGAFLFRWFVLALPFVASGRAQPPTAAATGEARTICVLLLPVLDETPDARNMLAPRRSVIRHRQQVEFIARQFKVAGEVIAVKMAAQNPRIDLVELSARRTDNLDELGRRTGADWVVNMIVQQVAMDTRTDSGFQIHTRLLLQIRDTRKHDWVANFVHEGRSTGQGSPAMIFKQSLDDATRESLEGALGGYAQVVKIDQENSLKDYLLGQREVFVPDPQKIFSGLIQ
ncbi:MAG TPA: hypothetical protein VGM64_03875 [Lacunisphaera sp.]